jgi:inorganic triphosphatase YgiF
MKRMAEFLGIIQDATNSELREYLEELENELTRSNLAIEEGFEKDIDDEVG